MAGRHETHIKKPDLLYLCLFQIPPYGTYLGIQAFLALDMVHSDESKGTIIGAAIV